MNVNDAVHITVTISLVANDPENPWPTEFSYCMPANEAHDYLRNLAKACRNGRAFGFMMAECASNYESFEWRMRNPLNGDLTEIVADENGYGKVLSAVAAQPVTTET